MVIAACFVIIGCSGLLVIVQRVTVLSLLAAVDLLVIRVLSLLAAVGRRLLQRVLKLVTAGLPIIALCLVIIALCLVVIDWFVSCLC